MNMYTLKTCSNSCRLCPLLRLPYLLREGVVAELCPCGVVRAKTVSLWGGWVQRWMQHPVALFVLGPALHATWPPCVGCSPLSG